MRNGASAEAMSPRRFFCALLAVAASSFLGAPVSAEIVPLPVAESVPASPEHGKVPVSAQFRMPDDFVVSDETTTIICQVLVSTKGIVSERKCGQHGGSDRMRAWLRNEVHHRMKRARFRPAIVAGKEVAVSMPVRVVVSCDDQADCGVGVYPNSGQYASELGNAYYAPQEVISKVGTWYDRLVASDDCRSGKAKVCKGVAAFAFGAAVRVGEDGLVNGVGLLADADPGDFPAEAAFARVVESRFIPAQVQGAPTTLLVHTPTIHTRGNKHFRRDQCRDASELGTRLGRECYTMQEYAALRPNDEGGFGENLEFWVLDLNGTAGE